MLCARACVCVCMLRVCVCEHVCVCVHMCMHALCMHVRVCCVCMCERPCMCMCGSMHRKVESMWVNPPGGRSSTSTLQKNRQCLMDDDDMSTDNLSTT